MNPELSSAQLKKIILNIKMSSILIQFTYLAFPLSMYVVYNKIIANHNPAAIFVVVIFLLTILSIQLLLKIIETIQKNILKSDNLFKEHKAYLNKKLSNPNLNNFNKNNQFNLADLTEISKKSSEKIQHYVSKNYLNFLVIYFILITLVGQFIVIVPIMFLSLNYLIARSLTHKHDQAADKFNKLLNTKTAFVKEMFTKHNEIKGLNITQATISKYSKITFTVNKYKCIALYYKNLLIKISMVINMINIAFILIFGRFLHSYGLLSMQAIIACSLLTVWISRSIGQVFLTLSSTKLKSETNTISNMDSSELNQDINQNINQITQAQFKQIQSQLEQHPIVYWRQKNNISLYNLKDMYKNLYISISYLDSNFKLFYGSILDNLTLFNESRYEEAKTIINQFGVGNLINNLPYQLNYVTTGTHDEAVSYDLLLTISIIRELIKKPDLIILDINSDEISDNIKKALFHYIKENNIKLIIKENKFMQEIATLQH